MYTFHGYTDRHARKLSWAEEADCEDTGPHPDGSIFPESPRHVTTWRFADYPPVKVLGVRSGSTDSFAVFVADSVPAKERDVIYEDLAGGVRWEGRPRPRIGRHEGSGDPATSSPGSGGGRKYA